MANFARFIRLFADGRDGLHNHAFLQSGYPRSHNHITFLETIRNGDVRAGRSHRIFVTRDYGPLRIDDIEIQASVGDGASSLHTGGMHRRGSQFTINAPLGKHEMSLQYRFRAAPSDSIENEAFSQLSRADSIESEGAARKR